MNHVIASNRSWCKELPEKLAKKTGKPFYAINFNKDLNLENLESINPRYIFFTHWSYIIPKEIYQKFDCVIFHMTDVP